MSSDNDKIGERVAVLESQVGDLRKDYDKVMDTIGDTTKELVKTRIDMAKSLSNNRTYVVVITVLVAVLSAFISRTI